MFHYNVVFIGHKLRQIHFLIMCYLVNLLKFCLKKTVFLPQKHNPRLMIRKFDHFLVVCSVPSVKMNCLPKKMFVKDRFSSSRMVSQSRPKFNYPLALNRSYHNVQQIEFSLSLDFFWIYHRMVGNPCCSWEVCTNVFKI